ncbi:DEAD/DEAH box helicase [Magnetospirillum aberrantis]|uniref:DEAD/DEAH box helicase n=1 Tax=Magnetospirillum aberrantis SpK TaxID=908842 RepID=A0A7C9QV43_9PROT|nr:DEAD/DEAH box helicase [Magnetospirillum aberrantis]NFV80016.1 DEAD/DEAH box helicase [Magnetospirillum aberrantis SpK]
MSNALRPYQRNAANEIMALLMRRRSPCFVLPTRGGKTRVMTEVTGTVTGAAGWRVGFFVHRVELLKQASAALTRASIAHGVIAPGSGVTSHRVHVASIDTILTRLRAGCAETARWLASLDLACLDEAHHAVAGKWLALANALAKALLLGVTATPYRSDGQGLGDVFSDAVRGPTMRRLMQDGWLADFGVVAPPTKLNLSDLSVRGRGDFTADQLRVLLDNPDFIRAPVRAYGRFAPGQSCVVFCGGVLHAQHTAEAFRRAGWRAISIDGDTPPAERAAALEGLADGTVQVVTSCDLISEGTDLPEVGAAILARPTKSTQLFMQQAGRPLTPHGDKGRALIIDLVRNTMAHGMVDAERPWTLEGGVKGLERQVEGTIRCPTCWRVVGAGDAGRCCPECRNPYPARTAVIQPGSNAFVSVGALAIDDIRRLPLMRVVEHIGSRRDAEIVAKVLKISDRSWVDRVVEQRRAA